MRGNKSKKEDILAIFYAFTGGCIFKKYMI